MNSKVFLLSLLVLFSLSFAAVDVTFFYGTGCPHCAATELTFEAISQDYSLNFIEKEVYYNEENKLEMFSYYDYFNVSQLDAGVPTTIVNGEAMVIGEMTEAQWRSLLDDCEDEDGCTVGIYSKGSYDPPHDQETDAELTLTVLVGAAIVDSINPCTIAVMVMLLAVILMSQGKEKALFAGLLFTITIFVMYFLMGLGLLRAIEFTEATNAFFMIITFLALVLSIMEIKAYFSYKPGFLSIEMPMFMRPYLKTAMKKATSLSGVVVVAVICSLFLLPCSSGPYLIVLGMVSKAWTAHSIFYLLLYNLIFVLPMFLISVFVYKGLTTVEEVKDFRNKYIRHLHLISGILLFLLFLLLLNQLFHFV